MAFRKKYEILVQYNHDITVIQECENKILLPEYKDKMNYSDIYWYGKNKNKGIAIITYGDLKIEKMEHDETFEYIIPLKIFNNSTSLYLLAVWTQMVNKSIYDSYVVQAARALYHYKQLLKYENIIIIGDFNSNAIWDNESPKEYTHSEMINYLKENQIISVYHELKKENHGNEIQPTLYFQRNLNKPYHIDYCFMNKNMLQKVKKFEIGKYLDYINKSDHMPLVIEIE